MPDVNILTSVERDALKKSFEAEKFKVVFENDAMVVYKGKIIKRLSNENLKRILGGGQKK